MAVSNVLAEKALRADVIAWLQRQTDAERLAAVWVPIGSGANIKSADPVVQRAALAIIAGMRRDGEFRAGAADLFFLWGTGSGAIELKRPAERDLFRQRPAGRPSTVQVDFARWCAEHDVPYVICRSLGEVESTLAAWGRLREPEPL